jgi:hypothetical protein
MAVRTATMARKLNIKAAVLRVHNCAFKGHRTVRKAALFAAAGDGK